MRINNNLMAMNTHRQLGLGNAAGAKSMEKLSSGFRINRAGDDAAGLAISEKMRSQIRGLNQASRNAQDGISLIQTAEGALNESHAILQRMRELAVQSANDTNTAEDRGEIQKEINQLTSEVSRISNNTEFNTMKLLNGDMDGAGAGAIHEAITVEFNSTTDFTAADATGTVTMNIGGEEYTINFTDAVAVAASTVDAGTRTINVGTDSAVNANLGSTLANLFHEMRGIDPTLSISQFDFTNATSTLTVTASASGDYAGNAGKDSIEVSAGIDAADITVVTEGSNGTTGTAALHIGANEDQSLSVSVQDMRSLALLISSTTSGGAFATEALSDNSGATEYALDVTTQANANDAITVINTALETVSTERAKLGAYQNRLEHTIKNLDTSSENLQASESRIRDVDMAKEMMEFTKNNILQQAAQAMLAQANQAPQGVLQLLR